MSYLWQELPMSFNQPNVIFALGLQEHPSDRHYYCNIEEARFEPKKTLTSTLNYS